MNKIKLLFIVDSIGLLSFLTVAFTGFYRWLYLSKVVSDTPEQAMRIIDITNTMATIHTWGAVVLTTVITIHVLLHVPWIKNAFRIVFKTKDKNIPSE